ncbi:MAG: cupredoxin domain-containing protein [SAR202 cluster bacterium]|nr:cupredoxin domain-containing protein [SAR202 cluster bacterium]MDP6513583.1 cupredoxin domain-containing protein [SAR202 cluster bacterium]MDP6714702.1 cupredoxin domain-containing protein [SAR202 cluster bacterium]
MHKKLLTLALLMGVIFMVFAACSDSSDEPAPAAPAIASPPTPPPAASSQAPAPANPSAPAVVGTAVSVGLDDAGGRGPFVFTPPDLTFKQGEVVNFSFTSEAQFHTWTVEDLDIDVAVDANETVNFDFTFDTPGTYEVICIPHEALGMVGTITVEASSAAAAPAPAAASAGASEITVGLDDGEGAGPFEFTPDNWEFSAGETVNFTLKAEGQFHTFTVADLDIDVNVDAGKTEKLTYTFDTAGTYELICVPHEALGMVGTITVR